MMMLYWLFIICCALAYFKVLTYQGSRNIDALQEFVQKTKSEQDNLEKMAADEFVPDQATVEDTVSSQKCLNFS